MLKREYIAAGLLLVLLALCIWNLHAVEKLSGEIQISLCKSSSAAEGLDYRKARSYYDEALKLWLSAEGYTHIFFSHGQINDASEAFYELEQLLAQEDTAALDAAYDKLRYLLYSLYDMERPSLGSIF